MFSAEIRFRILAKVPDEMVEDCVSDLIVAWRRGGQILSDEWPISTSGTLVRTFVSIPERNSLQRKHETKWVAEKRRALRSGGMSVPAHVILGREPSTLDSCACRRRSGFIVYTDFLSLESPVRCADCFGPVPLYQIPHTSPWGTHEDLIFWRQDYHHCDALHIGSGVGERFGHRELSQYDSHLSHEGIDCCKQISRVTKKPCYYYLYRYNARSKKQEAQRKCPSCGESWQLKEPWHGKFDFRCDRCHLLSNTAYALS